MDKATIFDIGCNNGDDTDFYLKKGFKVVAVDADKAMCETVSKRFSEQIKAGNCVVVHGAFSDNPGGALSNNPSSITFFICNENREWSSCNLHLVESRQKEGFSFRRVVVPIVSMRDLFAKHGRPYYLKIDIEGMDIIPLRLLAVEKELPQYISTEIQSHDLALALEQILVLSRLGYKKYYIFNQGMRKYVKAPMPPREGLYAEFDPEALTTGLFGKEIDGKWLEFDRAVERILRLCRLGLFMENKLFVKNGRRTILSKIYNRYRRHLLRNPCAHWDLHAKLD